MAVRTELLAAKFGGTSLATAQRFEEVAAIVRSDDRRKVIVVSCFLTTLVSLSLVWMGMMSARALMS